MSSYEVRAIKFIKQVFDYIENCKSVGDYWRAIDQFNIENRRAVRVSNGMTRVALMTSDYVVKIDYSKDVERFGGGAEECRFYEMASREGMAYLFAKIKPYCYKNRIFYIMPHVQGVGRTGADADHYMNEDEKDWCWEHDLYDLHCQNYGWKDGHVVIIDYGANEYRYRH